MILFFPLVRRAALLGFICSATLALHAQTVSIKIPPDTPTAEILQAAGRAYDGRNYEVARLLYAEVVKREPRHPRAWNGLGHAYLSLGQPKDAAECFRKQIEINSFDPWAYNNVGLALVQLHQEAEAEAMFRKQIEINPLDEYAHKNLGRLLLSYRPPGGSPKRAQEAVEVLEIASRISPKDLELRMLLGVACVAAGDQTKGEAIMAEARAQMPASALPFNGGDPIVGLFLNLKPAEAAISEAAEESHRIQAVLLAKPPAETTEDDERASDRQAALWAVMGEAYQRQNELASAETYLLAAWKWTQSSIIADRLGQLYEKQGAKAKAITFYRRAVASSPSYPASRERLEKLVPNKAAAKSLLNRNSGELSILRTLHLGRATRKGSSQYRLTLHLRGSAVTIAGVTFAQGDRALQGMEQMLSASKPSLSAPGDEEVVMVRNVMVYCSATSCTAVLMPSMTNAMMQKR